LRFRISAAIAVLFVSFAVAGHAQMYSFQYYGVDQGLTDLAVRALYQDARGFLWLSTENGVFRYDGERFQAMGQAEGLPASNAAMFGTAPDGSLLAGGKFGLYRQAGSDGRFEPLRMPGANKVMWGDGITSDGKGTTYLATDAGLMVMTASGLQMRLLAAPPHTGSSPASGVLVENGSVWWGCGDEICVSAEGRTTVFGTSAGLPAGSWRGMVRVGDGELWVQSVEGQVAVLRKGKSRFEKANLPELSSFGPRGLIRVDTKGNVIIPVGDGLAIERDGRWQMVGRPAGLHGPVYSVLQDREGSVWLGLAGHGLAKWLGYGEWEHFNSDSGLGSDLAYEVAPAGRDAFLAGTDAGLFLGRRTAKGWDWKRETQIGDTPIHTVRPDGHGRLWLGTEGKGAARLDMRTGKVEWFGPEQGLTVASPYTITLDRENRVWAASVTGLFVSDAPTGSSGALRFRPVDGILGSTFCLALVEAANGDIWAGAKDGLFRLSNGKWSQFTVEQGLSNNEVLSLAADKNGDI
jgi:ligand-binding sensor domain-containing protein